MDSLTVTQIVAWQLPDLDEVLPQGQKLQWAAALPSLQRGAVWKPGKIELFWDSLFRGFPVGALVVSEKLDQQHSTYGKLGGKTDPWPALEKRHLLDGQQRANAIALGFYDPFTKKEIVPDECILWIDLEPDSFPRGCTRQFLFRVTTPAHPWGYTREDDANRIETSHMRRAIEEAGWKAPTDKPFERPKPRELSPFAAKAPIPLAWLLREILNKQSGAKLWAAICDRCEAIQQKWAVKAVEVLRKSEAPQHLKEIEEAANCASCSCATRARVRHLKEIEEAANCAANATIAILEVSRKAILAPTRQEANVTAPGQNIANIEHLFQRLNNGGMPISPDDLRYSMIKAYWPGIEATIDAIKPLPMPASRLVLLGARAAQIEQGGLLESLPGDFSVETLRSMGVARPRTKQAITLMQYFGLSAENAPQEDAHVNIPFVRVIGVVESWLLYRGADDIGCPPALRTQIAQNSPEVYLLLMIFAKLVVDDSARAEAIRKPILALTTTLHWFSSDKGRAVRGIYAHLRRLKQVDQSFFTVCLQKVNNPNVKDNGVYKVISPDALRELIKCPPDKPEGWDFWKEIVEDPSGNDETKRAQLEKEVWPLVCGIIWNKEMLLWAQRAYMKERFGNYDKADAAMWEDHNRPWDYDHLLPKTNFDNLKHDNHYMKTYQNRGGTIGNFHILPLEENRQRQATPANKAFENRTPEELSLMLLACKEELDAFSLSREDIRDKDPRHILSFVAAVHRRIHAIYNDWFHSLGIASLLGDQMAPTGRPSSSPVSDAEPREQSGETCSV